MNNNCQCQGCNGISNEMVTLMNRIPVLRFLKEPAGTIDDLNIKYPQGLEYGAFALVSSDSANSFFAEWKSDTQTWEPIIGDVEAILENAYPILDTIFFNQNISLSSITNGRAIKVGNIWTNMISSATGKNINYLETTKWWDGSIMDDSKVDGVIYRKSGNLYLVDIDFYNGEKINISKYGVKGIGDETENIQKAIDFASLTKRGIVGEVSVTYSISTIELKDGLQSIDLQLKGLGASELGIVTMFNVKNCHISLSIDMINDDNVGIYGDSISNCIFEDCHIYNMQDNAMSSKFAMKLYYECVHNVIRRSKFVGYENRTNPALAHILIAFFGTGDRYGGIFINSGWPTPLKRPNSYNIIEDNEFFYSEVAVDILCGTNNIIRNNYCEKQMTRTFYIATGSSNNLIANNVCYGFGSSAILIGYGSQGNVISNNEVSQIPIYNVHGAEAAINIFASQYNKVINNVISSFTLHGIYAAINSVGNIIDGNTISGYYLAAIAIENEWISSANRPAGAAYSRTGWAAPPTSNDSSDQELPMGTLSWAQMDSRDNIIQNNIIGDSYPGREVGSIYLAQILSLDGRETKLYNNVIQNNSCIHEQQQGNKPLYFFESTPGNLYDNVLINTSIKNVNINRIVMTRGKLHFKKCYGNDGLDTGIYSHPSDATQIDVSRGKSIRVYNTNPIIITDLLNGIETQVVSLYFYGIGVTIAYSGAKIRTKGSIDANPPQNSIMIFEKINTVWVETSRSF